MPSYTADTDKTRLSCLVLSVSEVWTELATSKDCQRQKISKLFCPVCRQFRSQHWQDKTVLSCQCQWRELGITRNMLHSARSRLSVHVCKRTSGWIICHYSNSTNTIGCCSHVFTLHSYCPAILQADLTMECGSSGRSKCLWSVHLSWRSMPILGDDATQRRLRANDRTVRCCNRYESTHRDIRRPYTNKNRPNPIRLKIGWQWRYCDISSLCYDAML